MGNRKWIRTGSFLFVCMFLALGASGRAEGKGTVLGNGAPGGRKTVIEGKESSFGSRSPEAGAAAMEEGKEAAFGNRSPEAGAAAMEGKETAFGYGSPGAAAVERNENGKGKEIVLQNANLIEKVYQKLGKQPGSPLYESELQGLEGKLELTGIVSVSNGGELDFIRDYCELGRVYEWEVVFAPDLQGWTEEQLKGLGDLAQTVKVSSTEGTIPASALPYFTGTSELIFDIDDVAGEIPEGKVFPRQVESVELYRFAEGDYRNLLKCMWGSEVKKLSVYNGSQKEGKRYFWLDQAAGMKKLKYLDAGDSFLRIQDSESLEGMELCDLCGAVDKVTGFAFLEKLQGLGKVTLTVTEEMDLEPLLEKEELALRLVFCQAVVEFEEDIFARERAVVCDSLDRALGWKEKNGDEGNFLAIYQRYQDEGRKIECFSIRGWREEEREKMYNVRTFLRITDGERIYVLDPEDGEWGFGSYRHDYVSLKDINFDGIKDITLDMGSFGNQGASYETGWIWNREHGEYIRSDTYQQITNPRVDGEHKLVRSSWRNWAASHSWAIYRYENGEFVKKSELTEELLYGDKIPEGMDVPENAEVWQWVEEIYENGKVAETKSFVVAHVEGEADEYPEAYEKFYEEDSYWG